MLSIGAMAAGQSAYYLNLAREDYYLSGGEPEGHWHGKGAESLRLSGTVAKKDLSRLFQGYSPTGRPLVQNAGKVNRAPGYDLTFSAPKSLSVVWSQLNEARQRVIQSAHHEAVVAAIEYLEKHHAYSRIGKQGTERIRVQLVAALFEHSCSRALDPQLHTHALLLNLGVDGEGVARSIVSREFFKHKMLLGAFYRCQLAQLLQERLGLEVIRPDSTSGKASWIELRGVPLELLRHFSKRREAILNKLKERGLESAVAASFAALTTREAKSHVPPRKELHARWREEGRQLRFDAQRLIGRTQPSLLRDDVERRFHEVLAESVERLTSDRNFFSDTELLRASLEIAQEHCLPAETVVSRLAESLVQLPDRFVSLGVRNGQSLWTTQEVIELESQFRNSVEKLRERVFRGASTSAITKAILQPRGNGRNKFVLDPEQQEAVRCIAQRGEAIKVVCGIAGSGKTQMLAAAKETIEKAGYRVIGAALAGVAARNLQESTGIESLTIRSLIHRLQPNCSAVLKHHAKQLWRAARGKKTFAYSSLEIDRKTVLVIDEAGMVGVKDFARIVKAVVDQGGALVAIGDHKQLPAIERPDSFRYLVNEVGGATLTNIRRQQNEGDRRAVADIVEGDPEAALRHYAQQGRFVVGRDRGEIEEALISDWRRQGGAHQPSDHRIFVATRAEVERLNQLCQWERVKAGTVDATQRVEHQGRLFMVGDRVRFDASARSLGIYKGQCATVVGVKNALAGKYLAVAIDSDAMTFGERFRHAAKHHAKQVLNAAVGRYTEKLERRGEIVVIPLKSLNPKAKTYDSLSLAYASTTHLGQGTTVPNSYVLLSNNLSRELFYVQASRHRESLCLYATEEQSGRSLAELARRHRPVLQATGRQISASEHSPLAAHLRKSTSEPLATTFLKQLHSCKQEECRHEITRR